MVYSITVNIWVPAKIVENTSPLINTLSKENCDLGWVENAHITLKSIALQDGPLSEKQINEYCSIIESVTKNQRVFSLTLRGVGSFPNAIFAKVESDNIFNFHNKLNDLLPSGQPQFEGDNYVPHNSLILCSCPPNEEEFAEYKDKFFGRFNVAEVQLIEWNNHAPKVIKKFQLID